MCGETQRKKSEIKNIQATGEITKASIHLIVLISAVSFLVAPFAPPNQDHSLLYDTLKSLPFALKSVTIHSLL
jgi:hypothetical protein